MVFTKKWQSWNVTDTDDGTVEDSEPTNGDAIKLKDVPMFIFYFRLGTSAFLVLWQLYLNYRDIGSVDAEIREPQAISQREEVVKMSVGERRKELLDGFEEHKVQREVSEEDLKPSEEAVDEICEQDIENGLGLLFIPGRMLPQTETVPNNCAICLEAYEAGETVVWSGNAKCNHAFHHGCIAACLVKVKDGSTPCPMCRQDFTSEAVDDKKIDPVPL